MEPTSNLPGWVVYAIVVAVVVVGVVVWIVKMSLEGQTLVRRHMDRVEQDHAAWQHGGRRVCPHCGFWITAETQEQGIRKLQAMDLSEMQRTIQRVLELNADQPPEKFAGWLQVLAITRKEIDRDDYFICMGCQGLVKG